ncbi:MAG: CooT family nickel-binding protein [Planctomycetes bacterium]|nr:CooT family nickel-binding protein [Planctomycetota bacterium]
MCEANVYLREKGKEELILKEADIVRPQEDGLFMKSIFGEQKIMKAKIAEISLVDHKIIIEKL